MDYLLFGCWESLGKEKLKLFFFLNNLIGVLEFYELGFRVILVMVTSSLSCDSTLHTFFLVYLD